MKEVHAVSPELAQWIDAKFEVLKQDIHAQFIVLRQKVLGTEVSQPLVARETP